MSAPFVFGDDDPEDAWAATDPVIELLRNVAERVAWILDHAFIVRHASDVEEVIHHGQRLAADLETIIARVRAGRLEATE